MFPRLIGILSFHPTLLLAWAAMVWIGPMGVAASDDNLCSSEASYCDFETCERCGPTWFAETELLLMRYHRTGGVRVGTSTASTSDERVEFDLNAVPRLSLGLITEGGLGFRMQWWQHNHAEDAFVPATGTPPTAQRFAVDAYTVDLEIFEEFPVHRNWTLIPAGGFRFTGFEEHMHDNAEFRYNEFFGIAPVIGIEARRKLWYGNLYGRLRVATPMGDKRKGNLNDTPVRLLDTLHTQMEIAAGYRAMRQLPGGLTLSWWVGFETQEWFAMSSSFSTASEDQFDGDSDVGFGGLAFGLGLTR